MNFKPLKKTVLIAAIAFSGYGTLQAQVTTSSINGVVTQTAGKTTSGASIKATHVPSGTVYNGVSNNSGYFNLSNLRVGGPYRIEITYGKLEPMVYEDVYLQLGEPFALEANLSAEKEAKLEAVNIVSARRNRIKTGATTIVGKKQIENMPTLSRSLQDFTRLTPQANGNSFGGANNRYNNITIDGAVNNDVFGLAGSGTPGGQAGTQPISLDAIQEIQVAMAPFDVTQGNFTGAGVNAVTRSGTNKFEGSVYAFGRNQQTIGKSVITGEKSTKFSDVQYGVRVGGPLIKNKLFFFLNAEAGRRTYPLAFNAGEAGATMTEDIANQISEYVQNRYGYAVGSYGPMDVRTQNNKIFGKIDWNINDKHQLAVRYNFIDAFDDNISRSANYFRFGNNAYKFNNKQNVVVAELRSNFNSSFSNNLILGYSSIRDNRQTAGSLFPQVTIENIGNVSGATAEFGSQRSSVANQLDQDIFEITNNFKWNVGKSTFTLGTHNEFFRFRNLFINNYNGRWDFASVDDFINNNPRRVRATYSLIDGVDQPEAKFNASQLAFYLQGDSEVFKNFRLTYGLRLDIPVMGDKPLRNEKIETLFPGYRTDRTPSGQLLWAPRVGFNYNVNGDRSLTLRGGGGIFTGRVPFVWLSNQFTNSGMLFGTVDVTSGRGVINNGNGFDPNISNQRNMG
ncbi:MAG: TonB-dependent receptor, partial [Cruoricaptor ignavus]|nr:TonB-dependent receptor [Cruoricaptor ignavus]